MAKHDFPAAFFVSTKPISEGKATTVHKNQFVRANVPPERIYAAVHSYLDSHHLTENIYDGEQVRKHYRYDDFETARLKYLLNYVLPVEASAKIIADLFAKIVVDEATFCSEWYMSENEIKELHDRFGCIGSHAHSHMPLAELSEQQSHSEIFGSKLYLESITGAKIEAISYPLGNPKAVSYRERNLAEIAGYAFGFTMERSANLTLNTPQLFARIDCNDLPEVGKKPLFCMKNGKLEKIDGHRIGRRSYCVEK